MLFSAGAVLGGVSMFAGYMVVSATGPRAHMRQQQQQSTASVP